MFKHLFKLFILLFISGRIYADTEKYLCKAFDNDSQTEYEWNIAITQVQGDIFNLRGSALDNSWNYTGHGFRKENHFYFYWKMVKEGTTGLVHYTIENNNTLKGDWIAEDSKEVLTESCNLLTKSSF